MTLEDTQERSVEQRRDFRAGLWLAGIASILLGIVAIVFPFAASIALELLFGGVLVALGLVQMARAVFASEVASPVWTFVVGVLCVAAGVILLLYPLEGVVTLTLLLSVFLLLGGIAKMVGAWQMSPPRRRARNRPEVSGWGWLAAAGALSFLLGLILFFGLPVTGTWALGLFLGVDLIFLGASEIGAAASMSASERT